MIRLQLLGNALKSYFDDEYELGVLQATRVTSMDLISPMKIESIGGKRSVLMCVDDYSRYTWARFLRDKGDTFENFKKLCGTLMNEKGHVIDMIRRIRSDLEREFENKNFAYYYEDEGIKLEFFAPKTPQ